VKGTSLEVGTSEFDKYSKQTTLPLRDAKNILFPSSLLSILVRPYMLVCEGIGEKWISSKFNSSLSAMFVLKSATRPRFSETPCSRSQVSRAGGRPLDNFQNFKRPNRRNSTEQKETIFGSVLTNLQLHLNILCHRQRREGDRRAWPLLVTFLGGLIYWSSTWHRSCMNFASWIYSCICAPRSES